MLRGGAGQRKKNWGRQGSLEDFGAGAGRASLLDVRTFDGSNFCEASHIEEESVPEFVTFLLLPSF